MPSWTRVADGEDGAAAAGCRAAASAEAPPQGPAVVSLRAAALGAVAAAFLGGSLATAAAGRLARVPPRGGLGQSLAALEPLPAEGLFRELDAEEVSAVARFVAEELDCSTRYVELDACWLGGPESVSLKPPRKSDALRHLDHGGERPPRMAQVIVVRGDLEEHFVGVYDVGPLDGKGGLEEGATVALAKKHDWNRRPLDMSDASIVPIVDETVKTLEELLVYTCGNTWYQFDGFDPNRSGQIGWMSGANVFSSVSHRSSRVWFNWFLDSNEFQVNWLHTVPFSFDVLHHGPADRWLAENVSYCGQLFATPEALLEADRKGAVSRCKDIELTDYTWDVPGPDHGTRPRGRRDAAGRGEPPLDEVERTWQATSGGSVQWGDWELVVTVRPASGLAVHEVRWMGERVIYELSLSDAHAYYSGPSPGKQFHYSDKAYSLSQISADMVEGLDCPPGATFLDAATWISSWPNATYTYDPALAKPMKLACVFESPGWQGSSWRHTQLLNRHVTGRRGRMLVVRAIGTVGNYDYVTEVRFGEDGHIHVGEDFAGYPEMDRQVASAEGGPSAAPGRMLDTSGGKPEWGSTVHKGERPDQHGDNVQLLHAHFALFKVDLDVLGTSNDFLITRSTVSTEDGGLPKKVQVTKRVDREDNSTLLVANASAPGVWRVVNTGKLNARSGTPRGYAIQIGSSPAVQTLPRDHPFSIAGSFALRHLTVTKQKDEEPSGVHSLDFYALDDPIYSVDAFQADEESLVGQDLVCWVSIGKDHIGRTEDQPLVSNFGAYFTITPWDYHLENPQMQLDMMGKGPAEEVDLRFLTKTIP